MNRREFIQCAAVVGVYPRWDSVYEENSSVRLLPAAAGDLAGRESESGFKQALAVLSPALPPRGRIVIAPSASALKNEGLWSLLHAAWRGSNVLLDLCDGFASLPDRTLTRVNLKRYLDIEVLQPITYEKGDYIAYRWPRFGLVRHFTRVSYIQSSKNHEPAAWLGTNVVGVRKAVGIGDVVILGSALGSLLLARDEQAQEIFAGILAMFTRDNNEEVDWRQYGSQGLDSGPRFGPD
jgi:hypothetical protein